MLCELKVSNFAIIDNVHIQFRAGLNILSGETGAGKSILLKSLGLLMGEKAMADSVRTGSDTAVIEGSFDLSSRPDIRERLHEMGIETPEEQMVVRRIVSTQNKSRVYINGALSTLSGLRDVVSPLVELTGAAVPLIEMTGQHENRNLLSRTYHMDLLDQFAGLWRRRQDFASRFTRLQELKNEVDEIRKDNRRRMQREDFLIYQRDEIKAMNLKIGEEQEIESEFRRLKHSARLSEFATLAENSLYNDDDSITSRLHYLIQRASELGNLDPSLSARMEPLIAAKSLINEVSYELRDYLKSLDGDPARLEELEDRLASLRQLQKKYGNTAQEILAALEEIESELHQIANSDELLQEKDAEIKALENELSAEAKAMHDKRTQAAQQLAQRVNEELKDLNMKGLIFHVSVTTNESQQLTTNGISNVEFLTQASRSDLPRPLARVASGGEISRILLSIKQVVGAGAHPRTYLFDEVDTGVSGPTAEKVGRKLKRISNGQQLICVTHLPQVASFGDAHFFIHKATEAKAGVVTEVKELRKEARINEIARLISGEKITQTSLAHAKQLLAECKNTLSQQH